jgi:polysaccharide biosynthesis/export protein
MRVIRSLIVVLGIASAAAGCAQQPVAYMAYPGTYGGTYGGIDNVVYGGTPYAPAVAQTQYAPAAVAPTGYVGGPYAPAPGAPVAAAPGGYAYAPAPSPSPYGGLYANAAGGLGNYTLDAGDRLRVVVFGQEGLTNSYLIGASGFIDMPLIGSVQARGLTSDQLAGRISEKLRDGFIREPHVAVEVEAYRPFFILGEVTQPGQYPYTPNMTAETAVAIAGGFTPRALRKSVIVTRNYYGQQTKLSVPMTFPLRPGDTINVQERWF